MQAKKQRIQALTLFLIQQIKNVAEMIQKKHTHYSQQGIIPNLATWRAARSDRLVLREEERIDFNL